MTAEKMRRIIESELNRWKKQKGRKPLLLREARQVGKTYLAANLGKNFDHFVEVNFDFTPSLINIFDKDLDPQRITREISLLTEQPIIPGKTLLFLDEIQEAPNAICHAFLPTQLFCHGPPTLLSIICSCNYF